MAKDWFQTVLEDRCFHGSTAAFEVALQGYEQLIRDEPDRQVSTEIELALIRIRRVRNLIGIDEALDRLDVLDGRLGVDAKLQLKHRIVQQELLLYRDYDMHALIPEFEELAASAFCKEDNFLYALVANSLTIAHMMVGNLDRAEELCHDSISIFRRRDNKLQLGFAFNNYAIIKKKLCEYSESEKMLRRSLRIFKDLGIQWGVVLGYNNVGLIKMKLGDWQNAEFYFRKSMAAKEQIGTADMFDNKFTKNHEINLLHLKVLQREFEQSLVLAEDLSTRGEHFYSLKQRALISEFVADLRVEVSDYREAANQIDEARELVSRIAPESDVMTEIMRRQAQLYLLEGKEDDARKEALACIRLCKKITDKHEMGAALRILAEVYALHGLEKKASSTFETSINTLKSIGECYELMRSCIAYSEFLIDNENTDADIYLLEAKQLCKKLEIDYFMCQIMLLFSKFALNRRDYMEARAYAKRAEEICETLQDCDRKKLRGQILKHLTVLEKTVLKASTKSAQRLKTLGRIYEDARFPIEELKPELATDVAQNVGAESLFLAKAKATGYVVPIRYNISSNDAKHALHKQARCNIKEIFKGKDPKICKLSNGKRLVCVPGTGSGYALCTIFDEGKAFTPNELEFLFASVGALERVAEEYGDRPLVVESSDFLDEVSGKLKHPRGHFKEIITIDPEMIKTIRLAERASTSTVPILLEGETGVGKELFAKAIHSSSPRQKSAFITINAGGVPLSLLESQLFGHVKGAFTDAVTDRAGLIDEAKGGTILFDEIGEMCEELQVKLLRLLENGEYRRLGENTLRYADVRVVSATNKNLQSLVREQRFREDLYYRLSTVSFRVPPLRERKRDIEFLVRHFLNQGLEQIGMPVRRIDVDVKALEAFEYYRWPGNVRELRNEILRILSLIGNGELIRFGMLSDRIKEAFQSQDEGGILTQRVDRYERRLILKALEQNGWNRFKTAEEIGIPRTTLLFKMKRLNISR